MVSGGNDNWAWNMSTHTKTAAHYLPWRHDEPDNSNGDNEDAIMMTVGSMTLIDVTPVVGGPWYESQIICYICEYN